MPSDDPASYTSRGRSRPSWFDSGRLVPGEPLQGHQRAAVCVVGAGIAGATTALLLAREGLDVLLVDRHAAGYGMTGGTTAQFANAIDDRYVEIERLHGQEGAAAAARSHSAAIDDVEALVREENIACAFQRVDGWLYASSADAEPLLHKEAAAARRAGLDVEVTHAPPYPMYPGRSALWFPRQGQLHPLRYLEGVVAAFRRHGGRFATGVDVQKIEGGDEVVVHAANGFTVRARHVVVATNHPINSNSLIYTRQSPYRTYMIAAAIDRAAVPRAHYWDEMSPYHYVSVFDDASGGDGETLLVGGEDHKFGQAQDADERYERLEAWARERFPVREVTHRWSGQVQETNDGLAYIGHVPGMPERVYVATGDSGQGMTHGLIAARMLTDRIQGRENPYAWLYDPARRRHDWKEVAVEQANVGRQLLRWLQSGDVEDAQAIPPGHGAIVRRGPFKVAVYRDERGDVHEMNAMCTHRGCQVNWNNTEATWDCPCHGSTFAPRGQVLNGPATKPLRPFGGDPPVEGSDVPHQEPAARAADAHAPHHEKKTVE